MAFAGWMIVISGLFVFAAVFRARWPGHLWYAVPGAVFLVVGVALLVFLLRRLRAPES
jgi:hypothetical protein